MVSEGLTIIWQLNCLPSIQFYMVCYREGNKIGSCHYYLAITACYFTMK